MDKIRKLEHSYLSAQELFCFQPWLSLGLGLAAKPWGEGLMNVLLNLDINTMMRKKIQENWTILVLHNDEKLFSLQILVHALNNFLFEHKV